MQIDFNLNRCNLIHLCLLNTLINKKLLVGKRTQEMTILKNKVDKIIIVWIMKLLNMKFWPTKLIGGLIKNSMNQVLWATKLIGFDEKFNELGTLQICLENSMNFVRHRFVLKNEKLENNYVKIS